MLKTLARESGKNCFTDSPKANGYTHLLYEIHPPLNKEPGQEGGNRTLQTGYSLVHIWTLLKYRNPPTEGQCHPSDHPLPLWQDSHLFTPIFVFLSSKLERSSPPPQHYKESYCCAFQPSLTTLGKPHSIRHVYFIRRVHDILSVFMYIWAALWPCCPC